MGTVEKQGPDFRPIFPHSELLLKTEFNKAFIQIIECNRFSIL